MASCSPLNAPEPHVGHEHVRRHRIQQLLGFRQRRHGGHQVTVPREKGIGPPEDVRIGVDQNHERGHTPVPGRLMLAGRSQKRIHGIRWSERAGSGSETNEARARCATCRISFLQCVLTIRARLYAKTPERPFMSAAPRNGNFEADRPCVFVKMPEDSGRRHLAPNVVVQTVNHHAPIVLSLWSSARIVRCGG